MTEADQSDVAEQNRPVTDEDIETTPPVSDDPEAPDADAIEQSQPVPLDEDDYR